MKVGATLTLDSRPLEIDQEVGSQTKVRYVELNIVTFLPAIIGL